MTKRIKWQLPDLLLNNKIFNAKTPWACQGVFDKRIKRIKISVAGGINMQRVCFTTYQDKVYFLDLVSFFKACEKEGLLKHWCFTKHKNRTQEHYHIWLESEDNSSSRIGKFISGKFLAYHNEKDIIRYVCCNSDGSLHPSLHSNFNVKAELNL